MIQISSKPPWVSTEAWKAWQEFRETYRTRLEGPGKEKFDPELHFPELWLSEAEGKYNLTSKISLTDQDAIEEGRAYLDDEGYVIYKYEEQFAYDGPNIKPEGGVKITREPNLLDDMIRAKPVEESMF